MRRKQIIKPTEKVARIIFMLFLQFTLFIVFTNNIIAQETNPVVICTGGETFTSSGISLDFVIGEIVTESYTTQSLSITQGFLQGTEGELAIDVHSIIADDIIIYPNPSSDIFNIVYTGLDNPISVEVVNIQGCVVHSSQFINNPLAVGLEELNPGLYVFRVLFPGNSIVTKRIIKK